MNRDRLLLNSGGQVGLVPPWLLVTLSAAVLAKLWLVSGHDLFTKFRPHDDFLFVVLAQNLLNGEWLGEFNNKTLIKGIGYPLFIAASNWLSIPLLVAQQLLYMVACLTLLVAIRPWLKNPLQLTLIFLLLLFNPFTFNYPVVGAVLRASVYSSHTVLCFSAMLGLWRFSAVSPGKGLCWSLLLSVSITLLWFTREESIWIVPGFVLFGLLYVLPWHWNRSSLVITRAGLLLLPIALLVLTHFVIASINQHYYGVRVVNDLKSPEFVAALGGLMNIDEDEFQQYVIIGPRSQKKAFEVSPSFRELEPFLSARSSMPNSFYIWSLRSAVRKAGYYDQPHDASRTQDLYARIGVELRAACDTGKLKCLDRPPTLRPPLRRQHLEQGVSTFLGLATDAIGFSHHNSRSGEYLSKADSGVLLTFDYVTGEDAFRKSTHLAPRQPDFYRKRVAMKEYLMGRIAKIYRYLVPLLFIIAVFLHLRQLGLGLFNRSMEFKPLFGLVLGGSILSILTILTFVKLTLWEVTRPIQLVYPLILLYIAVMLIPDKPRKSISKA